MPVQLRHCCGWAVPWDQQTNGNDRQHDNTLKTTFCAALRVPTKPRDNNLAAGKCALSQQLPQHILRNMMQSSLYDLRLRPSHHMIFSHDLFAAVNRRSDWKSLAVTTGVATRAGAAVRQKCPVAFAANPVIRASRLDRIAADGCHRRSPHDHRLPCLQPASQIRAFLGCSSID